jgi:SAM-dependent methyltransferase
MLKQLLRRLVPPGIRRAYHRYRLRQEARRNAGRSPQEVFSDIYRNGRWAKGDGRAFHSGTGSRDAHVVGPYVAAMRAELLAHPGGPPRVVDLGCGDFTVGRQLLDLAAEYTAADVVPELIEHLKATVSDPRVRFVQLDLTRDELPAGDVCFVRQVFQHLSNAQIAAALDRLRRYPIVYITEHHPAPGPAVVPNRDKVQGAGIRLYDHSGVFLDAPPFGLPAERLQLVLEVPEAADGLPHEDRLYPPGVIRTHKLTH